MHIQELEDLQDLGDLARVCYSLRGTPDEEASLQRLWEAVEAFERTYYPPGKPRRPPLPPGAYSTAVEVPVAPTDPGDEIQTLGGLAGRIAAAAAAQTELQAYMILTGSTDEKGTA